MAGTSAASHIKKPQQALAREQHLKKLLMGIRQVNQLITKENDPAKLIQKACKKLTAPLGYFNAWIVLLDNDGQVTHTASSGMDQAFEAMDRQLRKGDFPRCVREALETKQVVVYENLPDNCAGCPLASSYAGRSGLSCRLHFKGKTHGVFCVSAPVEYARLKQEQKLFREVADDLGFALHNMEKEEERKLALHRLVESREKLDITLNSIGDGVITTDLQGRITHMNPVAEEMTAWTLKEALGKPLEEVFRIVNAKSHKKVANPVTKVLKTDKIQGLANHTLLIAKNGREYQIADTAAPIRTRQRKTLGVVLVFSDVTQKYAAEEQIRQTLDQLKESRQMLQTVLDTIPVRVFWKDKKLNYLGCNGTFALDAGLESPEQIIGKDDYKLRWRNDADFYRKDDRQVIRSGQAKLFYEEPQTTPDGGKIWLRTSKVPLVDTHKRVVGVLGTYEDITEKKRTAQLQKALFEIAAAVAFSKNLEELIAFIEQEIEQLIGAPNFYIALLDEETGMLSIPFEKTEKTAIPSFPAAGTLSGLVIKQREPMLVKREEMIRLNEAGKIRILGELSRVWMGVPLMAEGRAFGVLALQNYEREDAYTEKELQLMEFVSHQVSLAIQRKKNLDELILAKQKAEESDRLKTAFLNNLSHEIRTPVNAIAGFAEVLADKPLPPDRTREILRIITRSSAQLLSIIDDIINLSTIETGQMRVHRSQTNLNLVLDHVFHQLQGEAQSKGLKFVRSVWLSDDKALVMTDETKLTQILTNLVSNAIKFTDKGHVEYGCTIEERMLRFYVADTGPGIPVHMRKHIFKRFRQGETELSRKKAGMGLGLSITQSFVELMGGKVWLESEMGAGSTFFFTLPYQPA